MVGGRLLNIFTEFYLRSDVITDLSIDSPKWIGAWWIGFLLIVVLSYVCAGLLALFPESLPTARITFNDDEKKAVENSSYVTLMKDLPKALYELISNATYMFISAGATMDGFLLAGKRFKIF